MIVGKYAGVFCHNNRQAVLNYWQYCIDETVKAGFNPIKASTMEHDNLLFYASQKGINALNYVKAMLS